MLDEVPPLVVPPFAEPASPPAPPSVLEPALPPAPSSILVRSTLVMSEQPARPSPMQGKRTEKMRLDNIGTCLGGDRKRRAMQGISHGGGERGKGKEQDGPSSL